MLQIETRFYKNDSFQVQIGDGEILDFSNRNFNDEDCERLVQLLLSKPNEEGVCIKEINLSHNQITDEGAKILTELSPYPIYLDLSYNKLTLKGFGELLKARDENWSLTWGSMCFGFKWEHNLFELPKRIDLWIAFATGNYWENKKA